VRIGHGATARRAVTARAEFEQFVADSGDALLRTAYLVVWDLPEAEDLVQECLLTVARRWPRVRSMDHPPAYARRVLINLALDGAGRRSRRRAELERPADSPELAAAAGQESTAEIGVIDLRSELVQALGTLPPRQRAVLVLRYFEDLSEAQTAAALGCSVGTVKSSASRGLTRLQSAIPGGRPQTSLTPKEQAR
jgi:RNA polymerase sigma-70 factor (sigma-E family)